MRERCSGGKYELDLEGYGIAPGKGIEESSPHKEQGIKGHRTANT